MKNKHFTLVFVVLCQLLFAQTGRENEKLMLVHADALKGQKVGEEEVRQFIGNVEFRQGKATLTCERATQYELAGKFVLVGDVAFIDTSKSLFGDQITYYEATRISYVEGHVRLVDSSKTMTADRLRYLDEEKIAFADGRVALRDEKEQITLIGEHAEYDQENGYAKVTGDAVLTKKDTTDADSLIIYGGLFEMFKDGDRFIVTDSVRLIRGEIEAFCDSLEYFQQESRLKLANKPRIRQGEQYLTGQAVSLVLDDADVQAIHIVGNAIVASVVDSSIRTNVPYDLLTGQEMMVYVTDEKIDSVRIDERATSYYHVIEEGKEKGLNKALGDALFITFDQDTLKRVRVISSPSVSVGEFHPPTHKALLETELEEQLAKLGIKITPPTITSGTQTVMDNNQESTVQTK